MIGGRPLGRRPRTLARSAAEPAHCFVYKSPPFLLFLLSPSPHLPPFLNSSQTTPAFRLARGRAHWWAGGAWSWVGAPGGEVGEVPGQKWGGRGAWGEGSDFGLLPLPTCWCRTLGASGWERLAEGGGRERGLEKVGPRKKRYLLSRPGGERDSDSWWEVGGWSPPWRETGCACVCPWVPVRGHVRVSACAGVGLALLRVSTAG